MSVALRWMTIYRYTVVMVCNQKLRPHTHGHTHARTLTSRTHTALLDPVWDHSGELATER